MIIVDMDIPLGYPGFMRSILNLLRSFWLLLFPFLAVLGYAAYVGGTGGIPEEMLCSDYHAVVRIRYVIWSFALPLLVVGGLGVFTTSGIVGPQCFMAGLRFALGFNRKKTCSLAAESLGKAARVVTWTGFWTGTVAALMYWLFGPYLESSMNYSIYRMEHELSWWVSRAPVVGLVLGRIMLGSLADSAWILTGKTGKPAFSFLHDLALFVVICFPGVSFYFMFAHL